MTIARSTYVRFAFALLMAWAAPSLYAQDGVKGALYQAKVTSLEGSLAVADFDNDQKPDGAVLVSSAGLYSSNNIRIELHLTGHQNTQLSFQSSQTRLEIVAFDIDHDGDTDLVVQQAFTHQRVNVWINDGNGSFHEGQLQDYSSPVLGARESVNLPSSQPQGPALGLPSNRGFEIATLSLALLARPPSADKFRPLSPAFAAVSCAVAANSSRAPPLL